MKESVKQLKSLLEYNINKFGNKYFIELDKQIRNDKTLSKNKEIIDLLDKYKQELKKNINNEKYKRNIM